MNGLGGRQPEASMSTSSTIMNRRLGSDSAVPRRFALARKSTDSSRIIGNFGKLAGLPFGADKRAESKTVLASDSASPVDKAPLKRRRVPSGMTRLFFFSIYVLNLGEAPQTTRRLSNSKAIPSDAEIIEISDDNDDDDDDLLSSISQAKSKSKSSKPHFEILSAPAQVRQGSRTARIVSGSTFRSATKEFLPKKAPIEIIEISDDEPLPSKTQPRENNVNRSSSGRLSELLQERATWSSPRSGQSRHSISSLGGDSLGNDGYADAMNIDDDDPINIPSSSPQALSQELQVPDDTNDNQGTRFTPLPSSSPSSVGLSPKYNYLSTPASTSPVALLPKSSPVRQSFTLRTSPNSMKKPITAGPSIGTSTGSSSNRLGFSPVTVSSSLQAPPPADKHRRQFARKLASRPISYEDEDVGESSSEPKGTANTKANKGKEKEIREPSSSSGTESINMRVLRDALIMGSDTLKQRPVSSTLPKKQGQTLAEAITSAGQLNRTKKMRRLLRRDTKDVPVDLTSGVKAGVKDGLKADENEKAIKAAIGSSRLLVNNLLPTFKERSASAAAKGD